MKTSLIRSVAISFLALCALCLPNLRAYGQLVPTVAQQNALNPRINETVYSDNTFHKPIVCFCDMFFQNVPPGFAITNGVAFPAPGQSGVGYPGWCIDSNHDISSGGNYQPVLYSSLDVAALAAAGITTDVWGRINYILNHKNDQPGTTASDIQKAIWHFIGGGAGEAFLDSALGASFGFVAPDAGRVSALIAAADAHPNFVPAHGQGVAIILDLT